MDKNGEIPWSCLAPSGARKAKVWHTSDETAVLGWRLAAASPATFAPSRRTEYVHASSVHVPVDAARQINNKKEL
jgi:hypothetical protein